MLMGGIYPPCATKQRYWDVLFTLFEGGCLDPAAPGAGRSSQIWTDLATASWIYHGSTASALLTNADGMFFFFFFLHQLQPSVLC